MYRLYWQSEEATDWMDFSPMYGFPTRAAAEAAIPASEIEALRRCATDEERDVITMGAWLVLEYTEDGQRVREE